MIEDAIDEALRIKRLSLGQLPPQHNTADRSIEVFDWAEHTWYRAYVSVSSGNPIFEALVYSGFLSTQNKRTPSGYSGWTTANNIGENCLSKLHYMQIKEKLFTIDKGE